jgi:hypothetical protein
MIKGVINGEEVLLQFHTAADPVFAKTILAGIKISLATRGEASIEISTY